MDTPLPLRERAMMAIPCCPRSLQNLSFEQPQDEPVRREESRAGDLRAIREARVAIQRAPGRHKPGNRRRERQRQPQRRARPRATAHVRTVAEVIGIACDGQGTGALRVQPKPPQKYVACEILRDGEHDGRHTKSLEYPPRRAATRRRSPGRDACARGHTRFP